MSTTRLANNTDYTVNKFEHVEGGARLKKGTRVGAYCIVAKGKDPGCSVPVNKQNDRHTQLET